MRHRVVIALRRARGAGTAAWSGSRPVAAAIVLGALLAAGTQPVCAQLAPGGPARTITDVQPAVERRVFELSTRHRDPVIVEGGHWGPGYHGRVHDGVLVVVPNVVLGWGGRPPHVPPSSLPWRHGPHAPGFAPGHAVPNAPHAHPPYGHAPHGHPTHVHPPHVHPPHVHQPHVHPPHAHPLPGGRRGDQGPPVGSLHRWSDGRGQR